MVPIRTNRVSRIAVVMLAAVVALPLAATSSMTVASATTTDGAIIGVTPGWNLDANDNTMGPDIGTFGACNTPPSAPGYVHDMNDWQGKHSTVIQYYGGIDDTTTTNNFGYSNICNNAQFAPWIWNHYDAIP